MQKFLSHLFARLMKSWSWVLLITGTIAIKWVSLYPDWVERNYTYGVYPLISSAQRFLLGWIPFSIGDLFYGFLILVILFRTFRFFRLLFQKKLTRNYFVQALQQAIFFFLFVYVFFNLLWGLNYNRLGVSPQLGLEVKTYAQADLDSLISQLQSRLNLYAPLVSKLQRDSFNRKKLLFTESSQAFKEAEKQHAFLRYRPVSIKPSLFSYAGNYLGFQGYYNPFSGEAQVNTTIPRVIEPFVTTHEIAHQLGYAKENEANFVAFLACHESSSVALKYSMYFDMYLYAKRELARRDTLLAKSIDSLLHPQVHADIREYREFFKKYRNPIEPVIMWAYGHYLKANNQPGGKQTYNEVVAWLIAYYKKFGINSL
ncbi:MAG TPA: DUF3810 domain-containing protein [Chitinophagaceae bacterium]|nr:DUF3810 domain-containing protein [Chitinophagaceae bacterium]